MKKLFFKICDKLFLGPYSIKINKTTYVDFPKVAPIFTLAFLLATIGSINGLKEVENTGLILILVGMFGFFYPNIFNRYK